MKPEIESIAESIVWNHAPIVDEYTGDLYLYRKMKGFYKRQDERSLENLVTRALGKRFTKKDFHELMTYLKTLNVQEDINWSSRYICLKNGTFDLEKQAIVENDKKNMCLNYINTTYTPGLGCEKMRSYVRSCVSSDVESEALQEFVGYLFVPGQPAKKAFYLYGPQDSGKSTFVNLIEEFVGPDNTENASYRQLCDDKFVLQHLMQKRLNSNSEEVKSDVPIQFLDTIKVLTGGDSIYGDVKHSNMRRRFTNPAKLLFAGNELPEHSIFDGASSTVTLNRWVIINFPNRFTVDGTFKARFFNDETFSELFNYALEGYQRLKKTWRFSYEGIHLWTVKALS